MQLKVFLMIVALAALQLGSAQECGVVVMAEDELREEINKTIHTALEAERDQCKQEINNAVKWAVENITDTVQQLLDPLLTDFVQHHLPGTTSDHPATSCEEVKNSNPNSLSGYYWTQTATHPLVQQYCDFDPVELPQDDPVGLSQDNPAKSCKEIKEQYPDISSGYYWVENSEGEVIQTYCDMERTCGNVTGGWMRVADINMTDPSDSCPSGLNEATINSVRFCAMNIPGAGCSSATISTYDVQYSHVCGKIIGYQDGTPDAFSNYRFNPSLTIDDVYVDGIILTHGESPRNHIWTFAVAHDETASTGYNVCPCTNSNNPYTINIPSFVGNEYFCETGNTSLASVSAFYSDDPLWDGKGCGPLSTCCSFNKPSMVLKAASLTHSQ